MKNRNFKKGRLHKLKAVALSATEQTIKWNILLTAAVLLTLIAHALLINHLNTVNFKLTDLKGEASTLIEKNGEYEARISETQTLGAIEGRAVEIGMVVVDEYTFLRGVDSTVAKR